MYNNTRANETLNVLSLLKYTNSYADTVGKDQFFYPDTSTVITESRPAQGLYNAGFARRKLLTDAAAVNKISIPLNLYSYFAAFKNQLHPKTKTKIILKLENDNNVKNRELGILGQAHPSTKKPIPIRSHSTQTHPKPTQR